MWDRDRNLLFGVFAVQLKLISHAKIMEFAAAWSADQSKHLPDRLEAAGLLTQRDRQLILDFVQRAIDAHGGDSAVALQNFGGEALAFQSLSLSPSAFDFDNENALQTSAMGLDAYGEAELPRVVEAPGRYTLKSEHSRGGQGRLLLVYDEQLNRDVILKELLLGAEAGHGVSTPIRKSVGLVSRFLQEARIAGQLEHPSIVPVYELGLRSEGTPYYTMKLVKGKTLFAAIRERRTLRERLGLLKHFHDLCNGIAYAHSRGVIHRDLKPQNVMIGMFGETVILDWGLAKIKGQDEGRDDLVASSLDKLRASADLTETAQDAVIGTPVYMSPEQARGDVHAIDERSDVYSLGMTLFELITGDIPYKSSTMKQVIAEILTRPQPSCTLLQPDVPPALAAICDRCICAKPEDRYQTAKEVADDIDRFMSGALVQAYSYKTHEILLREYRRHRHTVHAVAAAAVLLFVLAGFSYVQIRAARDRAIIAQHQAEAENYTSTLHLVDQHIKNNNMDLASRALLGIPEAFRGWEWGYLLGRCNQELLSLSERSVVAYSPDGSMFATGSRSRPIEIFSSDALQLVSTIGEPGVRPVSIQFSPDGKRILGATLANKIRVWALDTGAQTTEIRGFSDVPADATFTPDGQHILARISSVTFGVFDSSNGGLKHTFAVPGQLAAAMTLSEDGRRLSIFSYEENKPDVNENASVGVYDLVTQTYRAIAAGYLAVFSPDSRRLLIANGLEVRQFDANTGEPRIALQKHQAHIHSIGFLEGGKEVFTASADGVIHISNAETGQLRLTLDHKHPIDRVKAINPDGYIVAGSKEGALTVWDSTNGAQIAALQGHTDNVHTLAVNPRGKQFATASLDQSVKIWSATYSPSMQHLALASAQVMKAFMSPDNSLIALAEKMQYEVFETSTGKLKAVFLGQEDRIGSVAAFSEDNQFLALSFDDSTPSVMNLKDMRIVTAYTGHNAAVRAMAYDPDGEFVVSGDQDGHVRSWSPQSGATKASLDLQSEIIALDCDPNSDWSAIGTVDGVLLMWNAVTGEVGRRLEGHVNRINDVLFTADGKKLISCSTDRTCYMWSLETGERIREFEGHTLPIASVALNRDESRLITCSLDALGIWSIASGDLLATIALPKNYLKIAGYTSDYSAIVTAENDGPIRKWKAVPVHADEWPGTADMAVADRLTQYFTELRNRPSSTPSNDYTIVVTMSERDRTEVAAKLKNAVQSGMPVLVDAALLPQMNRLPLQVEDEIVEANADLLQLAVRRQSETITIKTLVINDRASGLQQAAHGDEVTGGDGVTAVSVEAVEEK